MINRRLTKTELKDNWTKTRFRKKLSRVAEKLGAITIEVKSKGLKRKVFPLIYLFDPRLPYIIGEGETAYYVKQFR